MDCLQDICCAAAESLSAGVRGLSRSKAVGWLAGGHSSCCHQAAKCRSRRAASLDGSARALVLSVEDKVEFLDTRSSPRRQAEPRWLDAYTVCLHYRTYLAPDVPPQCASPHIPVIWGQYQGELHGAQVPGQYVGVRRQSQDSAADRTLSEGDCPAERLLAMRPRRMMLDGSHPCWTLPSLRCAGDTADLTAARSVSCLQCRTWAIMRALSTDRTECFQIP